MRATIHGFRIAVIALAIYWITIFVLTHLPPNPLMYWVGRSDKFVHGAAFTMLAFLMAWAIPTNRNRLHDNVGLAAVFGVIYAGFDELLQIPVGRTADWADFFADCVGILFGLAIYTMIRNAILKARVQIFQNPDSDSLQKPL